MEYLNSIYYTFSTIAQVLAGFIALGGVFVLFKLQELNKLQLFRAQNFYTYMSGSGLDYSSYYGCENIAVNLKTLRLAESTAGMIDEMNIILSDEKVKKIHQYKSLQMWKTSFERVERYKNMIKVFTFSSIIIGIITIFYSIIILSRTHLICKENLSIVIAFGLTFAILAITSMSFGIILSLMDFKFIKNPATNKP